MKGGSSKSNPTRIYEGISDSNINIQELLKAEIYDEKITPLSQNPFNSGKDQYQKSQPNKPYSSQTFGISDQYIVLDSFLKSPESILERGEIKWNIAPQGVTNLSPPLVGVIDNLSTVTEIEFGDFSMPFLPEFIYPLADIQTVLVLTNSDLALSQNNSTNTSPAPPVPSANLTPSLTEGPTGQMPVGLTTLINIPPWVNNPLSQILFGNKLTVQIKEAGLQSISDLNGNRHHFEFKIRYPILSEGTSPNVVNVSGAYSGSTKYIFTEPLIDLQTISLIFRNPDVPIIFDPDFFECNSFIDFTESIPTLTFKFPSHNLLTGDILNIVNFNTGFIVLDNYINRSNILQNGVLGIGAGLIVGAAPNSDGTSQKLPNSSKLVSVISGYNQSLPYFYLDPLVQFAKKGPIVIFRVTDYTPATAPGVIPAIPAKAKIEADIVVKVDEFVIPLVKTIFIYWVDTGTSQPYEAAFDFYGYPAFYIIYIYNVIPDPTSLPLPYKVNGGGFFTISNIPKGVISNYIVSNYINPVTATITAKISFIFGNTPITIFWNSLQHLYIGNFAIGAFTGTYQITFISVNAFNVVVDPIGTFCKVLYMNTQCGIYVAKRRIRIPVKVRTIVNKVTNYVIPI